MVKPGERFVELGTVRIVFDPALEKIFPERKILALCFHPKRESRLRRIVHGCRACVPGHVPRRHVPKQRNVRLQSRYLSEQKQNASPFRALPRHLRLDEKKIGDDRAKSAERSDETELSDSFAKIEVGDLTHAHLSMLQRARTLRRKLNHAEDEKQREGKDHATH